MSSTATSDPFLAEVYPVETLLARRGAIAAWDPWFRKLRYRSEAHADFLAWCESQGIEPGETFKLELAGDGILMWVAHRVGEGGTLHVPESCEEGDGENNSGFCLIKRMI
jgi:hypothetical protein